MIDLGAILDAARFTAGTLALAIVARWGRTAWRSWRHQRNGSVNWLVWCVLLWAAGEAFVGWAQGGMSLAGYPLDSIELTAVKLVYYAMVITAKCGIAGASDKIGASRRRSAVWLAASLAMLAAATFVMWGW